MARQTKSIEVLNLIKVFLQAHSWPADLPVPAEIIKGQSGYTVHFPSIGIVEGRNDEPSQTTGSAIRDQRIDIVISNPLDEVNPEQGYARLLGLALEVEDALRGIDWSSIPTSLDNYTGRSYGAWVGPRGNYMESMTLNLEVRFEEPFV